VFDWQLVYPDPYIPLALTAEIGGRMLADGTELEPLNEADIRCAVERFRQAGVQAIAVSYLWSTANADHERRTAEVIAQLWPDVPVTLGHRLNPVAREYRRTISAAIDASLRPSVSDYVTRLIDGMRRAGYDNDILLANCLGGMMPPSDIIDKPIYSVMSGPTLAPVAAKLLTTQPDVLVVDMGGTTFDVSAIRDGEIVISAEALIGDDMLGIPKVDVRSVGAGGGSIAWIDNGGLLHVGPQSSGARPGPACYRRGGTEPTVTDANLLLGYLDPDNFLGGEMKLDATAAETAVQTVADRLDVPLLDAAHAIYATSNNLMVGAIEDITVREGINPRDSYLVVGGGATSLHICDIAGELGMTELLIPRFAAGLSAFGGLVSDIRWEQHGAVFADSADFDADTINAELDRLSAEGRAFLSSAGVPDDRQQLSYAFKARYRYQSWEIEVPFVPENGHLSAKDSAALADLFHRTHHRIYSVMIPDDVVEFTSWIVKATGLSPQHRSPAQRVDTGATATPTGNRPTYQHPHRGLVDTDIYDGSRLRPGAAVHGPAIIEETTTTIVLPAGSVASVDGDGNYHVTLAAAVR
jgi:N-methylhydantoinase A